MRGESLLGMKRMIHSFWNDILKRDNDNLSKKFHKDAKIHWPSLGLIIDPESYVSRISKIPEGNWEFLINQIYITESKAFSLTKITNSDRNILFTAVSFFDFCDEMIIKLDEYWISDNEVPIPELNKSS